MYTAFYHDHVGKTCNSNLCGLPVCVNAACRNGLCAFPSLLVASDPNYPTAINVDPSNLRCLLLLRFLRSFVYNVALEDYSYMLYAVVTNTCIHFGPEEGVSPG